MTRSEHDFFKVVVRVVGDRYYVFPQIHLGTLIKPSVKWTRKWRLWKLAFFYSDKYSVDYVICDNKGIKPILVVELDDASHSKERRQYRDKFVERILQEADLPIERFATTEASNLELVRGRINKHLGSV
jgi:hypothetical protein